MPLPGLVGEGEEPGPSPVGDGSPYVSTQYDCPTVRALQSGAREGFCDSESAECH